MILNDKEYYFTVDEKTFHCSVDVAMRYLGGKWKAVTLWYLKDGTRRYGELKRLMPDVTERMLSKQLRELERHGLVLRKVYREVPPHVAYSLTAEGKKTVPIVIALAAWGYDYAKQNGELVPK